MYSSDLDLVMTGDETGNIDLAKIGNSKIEVLAQSIYVALQSKPGDFLLSRSFGASPSVFVGKPISAYLIREIEVYILNRLVSSGINMDKVPMSVKALPVSAHLIAVRVVLSPSVNENIKIDMIASTADASIQITRIGFSS